MVSEQKSPGFLKDLEEVQEDAGARIRLECRVSGRPKPSVSWTKDGNSIHVSSRVRIIEAYTSHTLLISRAESADSGVYAVTVTNQHGHETSTARVDINGTSAVSSRNYSPSPKPSVVSSARKIEIKSNAGAAAAGSRLDKTAASRLVTGNIWTRNSATAASGISSSTGGAPPRRRGPGFILRPKPKTVKVGESLNLKCTLLGHPKPTVTWEKNGELVDEERTDGHIQTSIDGNNYFLEIDRCKAEDGGKYAVTARNSLGKQMASVEVTITEGGAVSAATPSAKIPASPAAPPSKIAAAPATVTEVKREIKRTTNGDDVTNNNSSNTPQQQTTTSTTSTITSKMLITTSTKTTGNDNNNVPASPTGSVSSSLSVQSRQSSASSRSTHSVPEDHNGRAAVAANSTVLLISSPAPSSTAEQKQQKQQQQQEGRSVGAVEITRASTKKLLTLHAPTITRRLSSTQVLEGEELLLQCVISGDPEPELQWLRNGVEFNENQVFVSFRNGVARLRLRDVQLRHAGEYMCVARNDGGEVKCSSRVTVKAKPINKCPRFIKSPCDVRAVEGETLKLEAEVEGSPTPEIFWSIDGQEIQDADSSFINNVANLIIKNVTVSNTGQYMCNAINAGGEDSVACRVRIKEPKLNIRPEFTAPLTDVTVKKDETLCLRCMVTGIPEPSVSWYCDNQMIDDLEGVEVTFQDGVAGLSLDKVQGDDSGVYSCVAVNSEGEGKTSCDVIVQEDEPEPEPEPEPAPPVVVAPTPQPVQVVQPMPQPEPKKLPSVAPKFTQRFDEFIRTQEGDEVTLKCCFIASPEPTVTWMAGGKPVEGAQESQEPGKACITIPAISSTHSGSVRCVVSNGVGTIEHETRLSVRSRRTAPTIEKELPPTLVIEEGETAEIDCIVHGHPQPRVSWIRDNRSLSILSTETTYENGRATVKIRRATQRDSGRYVCTARNLSGDVETCCKVTVIAKAPEEEEKPKEEAKPVITIPTFVRELSDVELEDGQDLKLVCEVSGEPQPKIHWRVDDEPLDVDDSETTYQNGMASLFLEDVMQEDSGRYACVAENEAGKSQSSCMVKVNAATNGATEQKEPSFVVQLKDHSVKEGDDIKLTCTITGNPVPEVTWLLDGEEIVDAELRSDEDGVHELFLAESLPDDEGVYTCIAHNSLKRVMSSCKVTIDALESLNGGTGDQIPIDDEVRQPEFVKALSDSTIADGSKGYRLTCHVSGCPEPKATWYFGEDEILPCDDFQLVQEGQTRSLIFTEVFPEDTGDYACVIKNRAGAAKSSARITVEEIDGEAPNFLNKPRPVTANIGEIAIFSCQVDGDPAPAVSWICNGHDLTSDDHVRMIDGCADNNFTNSLEIDQVTALDAGRYSVTCSNLLGNITCTVSLIVNDAKQQETRTDFRDVLKKGSKSPTSASQNSKEQTGTGEEQVDFRGVLRKTSTGGEVPRKTASSESDDSKEAAGSMYKEALNTQVKTKSITEDERKKQKAEQVDFRSSLVRKVDTKITNQDELKVRQPEQQDFRDEALRTHVLTKQIGQDEIKKMQAEQVDFRAEAIKTKVVTKAYKEELVKTRKVEQVDFRTVLSPTKKESDDAFTSPVTSPTTNMTNIAEIPRGKWKRSEVHNNNTVVTKRSRNRGGSQAGTERKSSRKSEDAAPEEEVPMKPEFREELEDIEISEGGPFQLVCYVSGNPRPEVKWSIDDVELKAEDEFEIEYKGGRCSLSMGESLPDDEGIYTCRAVNVHGEAVTSASVTCSTAAPPSDRDDDDDVDDDVIDDDETPTNSPTKVEMPSIRIPVTPPPAVKMTEEKIKTPTTLATKANQRSISTITLTARATDKTEKTTKSFKLVPVKSEPTVNVNKTTSNGHGRPVTASKSEVTIRSSVTSPKPSKSAESKPTSANGRLETPEKPSVLLQIRLRSAQVSWKGVKKIRGLSSLYTIEERQEKTKKDDSRARVPEKKIWKAAASTIHTSYTFTNLREEVNYYYRIIANNNNNTSEPSEESEAVSLPAKQQMSTIRKSTSATMSYTLPQTPAAASRRFSCDNVTRLETHKLRGLPVTSVTSAIRKSTASGGGGILRTSTPLKTQNPATGGAREAKTSPTHKPSQSKADVTSSGDRTGGKKTTETKAVTSSVAVVSTKLQVSKKREEKKKGPEAAVNNGGMKIQDQINSLLLDGGKDEKIFHISMPNPDNLSSDSRSRRNKGDPQQQRGVRDDQQVSPLRKVREVPVLKSVLRNKSAVTPTTSSSSATSTDLFKKPLPPAEYAGSHRKASLVARNSVETSEGSTTVDEDQSDDGESRNFVKLPPVQIKYDEKFLELYDIHERLGQGRFGIVHRVTSRRNGRDYAAKIMRALKMKDQSSVQTEIEVMNLLRHPKLVQLVAAFSHGREITMVMECVSGGELFERVVDEDFELTERICVEYIRQICEGVGFMHDTSIIHLDLKPENILCVNKTGTKIKLIDFGLARKFDPKETTKVLLGTPEFVAPEVVNFDSIGFPTDMWSVGVICYILLSGLSPFAGDSDSETYTNITAVRWDFEDEAFDQISEDAKDFICHLLVKNMSQRFDFKQALGHAWLRRESRASKEDTKRLNTKNLRKYIVRRKWQKTGNAVRALARLQTLAKLRNGSGATSGGIQSGFVCSLKAQLSRENQPTRPQTSIRIRPRFITNFRNEECVSGSSVVLECSVIGRPKPEVTWLKDGRVINSSGHYRMACEREDMYKLSIRRVTRMDAGTYTCQAVNGAGREEISAHLAVRN